VIRNAPMVARNMYRPIDPITIPQPAPSIARFATAQQVRQPIPPEGNILRQHFHAFTKWPRQGKAIEHAH
jgi:hypothetical protein